LGRGRSDGGIVHGVGSLDRLTKDYQLSHFRGA
jgi:hypothetical protein